MVAPLWQLSVSFQHIIKSLTLNPYMSLCNLEHCTQIWSTKFVPPENVGQISPKCFGGCYSTKPLTNPNFAKIGLKCLRYPQSNICAPRKKWVSDMFFFCHGQKCDYLSRASLVARGATIKNKTHDCYV